MTRKVILCTSALTSVRIQSLKSRLLVPFVLSPPLSSVNLLQILSGYVLDEFLGPWVLLIKAVGLALAVASGLSLGKEGPLVHVACCWAYLLTRFLKPYRQNEGKHPPFPYQSPI